jgi:hypothetical protein
MLTSPFMVQSKEQVALFGFYGVAYWQTCHTQSKNLFILSSISFSTLAIANRLLIASYKHL